MGLLKRIWRLLVGVKDALALLALLLFFGALLSVLAWQTPSGSIADGGALNIRLDGVLVDQASPVPPLSLLSGEEIIPQTETRQLVRLIDRAADDPSIAMMTLDLDRFLGGGLADLESVGAALDRFRAKDKRIEAFATAYADSGYALAAHADRILLSPQGTVLLSGPGGSNLYFKDALDRLKVQVEVFRVGTYKSFVEPFTRNDSSPEAKAADEELAGDLWAQSREGIEKARPALDVAALAADWPERVARGNQDQAHVAKAAGLVDDVLSRNAWEAGLARQLGPGKDQKTPGDYKRVSAGDYWAARQPPKRSGDGVAVVHVAGSIVDGEAPAGTAGGDTIARLIGKALADKEVKALVVRIDSPGGSVLASEQIRLALEDAKARSIPVVASFGSVAASGGYWVATAADHIYASPSTVTGSIGVFGIIPTFERTLQEIGVSTDGVKTTELSGQPDILGGLNAPARLLIQRGVEDVYRQFIGHVAAARHMEPARVESMAEGRVWSGVRAKELGLIDDYGDLDAAVAEAARRAGLEGTPRVIDMQPAMPMLVQMLQRLGLAATTPAARDAVAHSILASRMRAIAEVRAAVDVANGASIQASCLSCGAYRMAAQPAGKTCLGALLRPLLSRGGSAISSLG